MIVKVEPVEYESIVVGGGAAGVAAISVAPRPTLWIDPQFGGGRLNNYTNVPSNTKAGLFIKYAGMSGFTKAVPVLEDMHNMNSNKGCNLLYAALMVKQLAEIPPVSVHKYTGTVQHISKLCDGKWVVIAVAEQNQEKDRFISKRVVLATGSHPRPPPKIPNIPTIDPELLLTPDHLPKVQIKASDVIGVIGSSHSAILILRTLLTHSPAHRIINIFRQPLRYAEYLSDGMIKYDNTGLKGEAAEWARQNLTEDGTCCNDRLLRIQGKDGDADSLLCGQCTKLVWAIGYERNELPTIYNNDGSVTPVLDYDANQSLLTTDGLPIANVFGIGIAFPERVIDMSGSPELSVGLYKFMRTAQKIKF